MDTIWAGLAGGVAMGMWAMMMRFSGFTRMSVPYYLGCSVTGKQAGAGSFMAGMMLHLVLSVLVAFAYAFFFEILWNYGSIFSGAILGATIGIGHWIVGGLMLPALDAVNGCVKRGGVAAMGRFAGGYGGTAVFTFLAGHLIFGTVFGWVYALLES